MGQYYIIANTDKKEMLTPYRFGSGAKLMEFSGDGESVMQGLAILLADGNGRGGGDLRADDSIIGSWAGDRIVVAGDYADEGNFTEGSEKTLYETALQSFEDVSSTVIRAIVAGEGSMSRMSKLDLEED